MAKSYSVAEARQQLPKLLHDVEDGQQIEITRRGKPVAIVLSLDSYRLLAKPDGDFSQNYAAWRNTIEEDDLAIADDFFDGLRDRSVGREVEI